MIFLSRSQLLIFQGGPPRPSDTISTEPNGIPNRPNRRTTVPYSKMSSKGRIELQMDLSGAEIREKPTGDVRFCVVPQKPIKNCEKLIFRPIFAEIFRTRPNASERIQTHPKPSERIRTGPGRTQQLRKPQKTCENLRKTCENFANHFEKIFAKPLVHPILS